MASRSAMVEFERAFEAACDEALREVLGASSFASTVFRLSSEGTALLDAARRPNEFDDALTAIFNPVSAMLIEGRILKRFYHSIGMRFEWNDGRVFKEEVEEASKQFGKHTLHPTQCQEGK